MAKPGEEYHMVEVESFVPPSTSGRHGTVHIRPVAGKGYPTTLFVECSKELSDTSKYPVGTRFKIKAKLTDRDGAGEYLYSYFGWKIEVLSVPKEDEIQSER